MNQELMTIKKLGIVAGVLLLGVSMSIASQVVLTFMFQDGTNLKPLATKEGTQVAQLVEDTTPFQGVQLEAKATYVFDLSTQKVLYAKNEETPLPLASVTKLMTALVARDALPKETLIKIHKEDLSTEGDSGLRQNEDWRLADLLDVMLIVSSNDAAHTVANFVGKQNLQTQENVNDFSQSFINMMNLKAQTLKFSSMKFYNESGLDIDSGAISPATPGAYGSAKDVALLMAHLWKTYPDALEVTARKDARITSEDNIDHVLPNTNEGLGHYSGMMGSKTGYTTLAGGNLVIIFDVGIGHPVVASVLGSSYKGRFDDMEKLTSATFEVLK